MSTYRFHDEDGDEVSNKLEYCKLEKKVVYHWCNSTFSIKDTGNEYIIIDSTGKELNLDYSDAAALVLCFRVLEEETDSKLMAGVLTKEKIIAKY